MWQIISIAMRKLCQVTFLFWLLYLNRFVADSCLINMSKNCVLMMGMFHHDMTLNKDTKTSGGTTGFSTNVGAVKRWKVNASSRAAFVQSSINIQTSLNRITTKTFLRQELY